MILESKTRSSKTIEWAAWIAKKPANAVVLKLTLQAIGETSHVFQRPCEDITGNFDELAETLLQTADDYTEQRRRETAFLLAYYDEHGSVVLSKPFRIRPNEEVTGKLPTPDGSLESLIAGLQGAAQAKDRLLLETMVKSFELYFQLVESLQNRIAYLEGQDINYRQLRNEMVTGTSEPDDRRFNQVMLLLDSFMKGRAAAAGASTVSQGAPKAQ